MEIKTALDFPRVEMELTTLLNRLKDGRHRMDGMRLLRNMSKMVTELSKLELTMRTTPGHNPTKVNAQLKAINDEITGLEQWVTLLLLY